MLFKPVWGEGDTHPVFQQVTEAFSLEQPGDEAGHATPPYVLNPCMALVNSYIFYTANIF
jgi:hypothetical protein